MSKIPNFNKKEKELLGSAIKKYLEVNNLTEIKLDNKLAIEIIDDAHDKWEIVSSLPQHKLRDSIKKKCGAKFETMEEKATREETERLASLKEKASQMQKDIKKKYDEEMAKEMKYYGVDETSLEAALNPKTEEVVSVSSRVEIMKGTMDEAPKEEESDFIGNISDPEPEPEIEIEATPVIEEVVEKVVEEVKEVIKEVVAETVEEVKEAVIEKGIEVAEETKKKVELDIDEILDNL